MRIHDVAVVGLGAVGSAALLQLARRGVDAIGVDRFAPPHDRGSSHGESRIMRQAIGEGDAYVPLVLRSNAIWEELEAATGERLLERCGFLFITRDDAGTSHHGHPGFLARTRAAAQRFGIAHDMLDVATVAQRFPQFVGLIGDERVYHEPGGGYLRPERCIAAALAEAMRAGATVLPDCRVLALERHGSDARLRLAGDTIVARHVVLATGGWLPELAPPKIARHVVVHRQALHWFPVVRPQLYDPQASPTFIWTHGLRSQEQFYGFPPIAGEVKVAQEDYTGAFDLDTGERAVDPAEGAAMARDHVGGHLAGLAALPSRSQVCHYAVTPDADFLIEAEPGVQIVSACSGHGFKHAAAVGEAVAQASIGEIPTIELAPFRADRLRIFTF